MTLDAAAGWRSGGIQQGHGLCASATVSHQWPTRLTLGARWTGCQLLDQPEPLLHRVEAAIGPEFGRSAVRVRPQIAAGAALSDGGPIAGTFGPSVDVTWQTGRWRIGGQVLAGVDVARLPGNITQARPFGGVGVVVGWGSRSLPHQEPPPRQAATTPLPPSDRNILAPATYRVHRDLTAISINALPKQTLRAHDRAMLAQLILLSNDASKRAARRWLERGATLSVRGRWLLSEALAMSEGQSLSSALEVYSNDDTPISDSFWEGATVGLVAAGVLAASADGPLPFGDILLLAAVGGMGKVATDTAERSISPGDEGEGQDEDDANDSEE